MASTRLDFPSLLYIGSVYRSSVVNLRIFCYVSAKRIQYAVPGVPARFPPMAVKLNGEIAATNPSRAL